MASRDSVIEEISSRIKDGWTWTQIQREFGTSGYPVRNVKRICEILAEQNYYHHNEPRGVWIHGDPDSDKVQSIVAEYDNVYEKNATNRWFDGYEDEQVIVMRGLEKKAAKKLCREIRQWTDWLGVKGEINRGHSFVQLRHHKFIITSRHLPKDIWPNDTNQIDSLNWRCEFIEA